ncbi:MAG: ABC transporter ATP-binding protein [Verrucomicrobia bacterium]|nr:ABC transporter ATP-binding protein [Verrucomicrobiota bacterium]
MIEFLKRIWVHVSPYRFRLMLGLVSGIVFALANGALAIGIRLVAALVFPGQDDLSFAALLEEMPEMLHPMLSALGSHLPPLTGSISKLGYVAVISILPVIMLVRAGFGYFNVYLTNWAAVRAVADLRTRLFNHLQQMPLSFYSQAKTGDLISRITNDTLVLHTIIANSLVSIVKDPVTIVALLALLLSEQPRLTLISAFVFPVCLVPIIVYGRKVRRSAKAMQTHTSEMTTLMHEAFTSSRVIKAYNLESTVMREFRETSDKFVNQMMRTVRSYELPSQMTEFVGALGVSLVFLYVVFVPEQQMSNAAFLQFVMSVYLMYQPLKSLSRLNNQLEQGRAASQRVFELLAMESTMPEPALPKPLTSANAEVAFENISFRYGEKPVLTDVNFRVAAGQMVALVGSSGSGKTTLTSLLLRFYDPQNGCVRIGGTDIRDVATRDLRNQIALVTQETILFNETIRHNIRLGRPEAADAEVQEAARHAYATAFIMATPDGFDTVVGEKGINLSGGQRQRIAIARAILKNAPILVLDEATSALDTESERAVQAALEELMTGRTTICIAHRLSTIQRADLIVVMDQGRVVESGKHEELLKRGGTYKKLYELQFQTNS